MFAGLMDYKNSMARKLMNQDKVDPGTFSFLEPGWWALHATAITAVYLLGTMMTKKMHHNNMEP